ncbi:3-dehydroquinate synthase [Corynebacterium auriscanis]|uniref:3-dehydroquinate synthase n=1 Tax=Corynebacterium auriscanis TaxID=99807 RepID=UPI0024AE257F|nr:3-dehydroquinate synthase [Corynebacterium auriscanis]
MTQIPVHSLNPYVVHIDRGLEFVAEQAMRATQNAQTYVLIHQPALAGRAAALAQILRDSDRTVHLVELADAERGKTIDEAARLWAACADAGLTRHDAVIGLGGGAATDVAGFIAATWMRGVAVIQCPTTLLAMVDAAVGGKTGINTEAGKNLVGAFHEPATVIVDLDVLETLPLAEIVAGSAEIIKAGFIRDTSILDIYVNDPDAALAPRGTLPELIEKAIKVKADVVGKDLKESHLREILNYGHTYGHAVEHHENYTWPHGHAVAVGMVFEAELAHAAGLLDGEAVKLHRQILQSVGLPIRYDGADLPTLNEAMSRDKKNKAGVTRFVVLDGIGSPTRLEGPSNELLETAYERTSR